MSPAVWIYFVCLSANFSLTKFTLDTRLAIAFDLSYINKLG